MNMQYKSAYLFHKERCISFVIVCTLILLLFFSLPFQAFAIENAGWVEVRVTVPEGFSDTIIVTVVQEETFEEHACRVMAINDYVAFWELPAGNYVFDGAFLESSDFRYNTTLTEDVGVIEVSAEPEAAAALISLKTTYNEEFEPKAEENMPLTPVIEEETVPETESVSNPTESEPIEEEEVTSEPESSEEATASKSGNLVRILVSTGIFIGIVFLVAFIFRRLQKRY